MPKWMRRPRLRLIVSLAVALVVLGGVACSALGSSTNLSAPAGKPESAGATSVPAPAQALKSAGAVPAAAGGPAVVSGAAPAAAVARDAAAPQANAPAAANPPLSTVAQSAAAAAQVDQRKVIRNGQLAIEVQDMEQALAQVRAIATRSGGFVSASSTRVEKVDNQERTFADLTLQVRSVAADSAISDLRGLGKVVSENSSSQDVTEEYVDLAANLDNLRASEAAILKLMDRASQIADVLALQRELTNVRGQIDRLQGRQRFIDNRTEMTAITVSLRLPSSGSSSRPVPGGAWDPAAVAQRGWQASLNLLRGVAEAVIVALAFSWWLVPLVAAGGYWLVRRRAASPRQPSAEAV